MKKVFKKLKHSNFVIALMFTLILFLPLQEKTEEGNVEAQRLSDNFLWGAATSAHQIEGGNILTDWSEFEKNQGNIKNNDNAITAVDGYNQAISDIKLLKDLGLNSYRFSIEWARVEPEKGKFDQVALDHYKNLINELKKDNIEPVVTLHHFTSPKWVLDKGGWENKEVIDDFSRFVEKVAVENEENVKYWITINEPSVIMNGGYLIGNFPPGKKNPLLFWRSYSNILIAHRKAYDLIHLKDQEAMVSVAYNVTNFEPKHNSLFDNASSNIADYAFSWLWLDKIQDKMDFAAVNYYREYYIGFGFPLADEYYKKTDKTDMNWNIQPDGLRKAIGKVHERYKKPIMVTENGLADRKDTKRSAFIKDHIESLKIANSEGADIIGYMHWSLMDNFEWKEGYDMKFGLYEIDRNTMERNARPSALDYKKIIELSTSGP